MNGLSETPSANGPTRNGTNASIARDEATPLLPRDEKESGIVRRCLLSRELCFAIVLALSLVVVGFFYFERRQHPPQPANLERLTVDVGLDRSEFANVSAQELIDKPRNDKRKYEVATLPNGLQVLTVQDKTSLKSAFAMAVRAGSYDDPEDLPGLAHFCEHMLFLGTKKYPEPSGFDDFMAKSGGEDNAYTAVEVTVYYGELSQPAAPEGMSRFADFFREPLFDKRYVHKEVHAIDSEHAKNVQSPSYRIVQALNSLADPKSPLGAFHTGNMDTLYELPKKKGKSPVDALEVYFRDHYCPKQMRLVLFGPASPKDQLSKAAKLFGSIPKGNAQCNGKRRSYASPNPWPANKLGKWLAIEGTEPRPQLWVSFPMPDVSHDFKSQPLQYLDYVLGYDGENSLSRVLQDSLGLVTGMQTMFDTASSGTSLYFVATLTSFGREHPESLLDVLFAYVAALRSNGVNTALYNSIADVMRLKWDWAEPEGGSSTASDLAERLTRLPVDNLLSGDMRIDEPNPKLVAELVGLMRPDNMNVAFVEPNYTNTKRAKGKHISTLPYYGVKYSIEEISAVLPGATERWNKWLESTGTGSLEKKFNARLSKSKLLDKGAIAPFPQVPKPIDGVPKNISLKHMAAKHGNANDVDEVLFGPRPSMVALKLSESQGGASLRGSRSDPTTPEVWYRSGWVTNSPKVTIQLDMRPLLSPEEGDMPVLDSVRLGLYSRLLGAEIAPKMADLTATGVSYDISVSAHGLSFSFGGFAPMLPKLVDTVLQEFNRFNENSNITLSSRFNRIRDELKEELSSYSEMPVSYAIDERVLLLSRGRHSNAESLAVLNDVSLESAAASARELLLSRPLQLTALAMGNLDQENAKAAVARVWDGLKRHLSPASLKVQGEVERVSPVVNPSQPVEVRAKNPRPGDPNDVVVVSFLAGVGNVENRVILGLLGQVLQNVAYNELRTSRQLGYVVSAGSGMLSNVQYMSTVVQGNVLQADDVEIAIESVLTELMPKRLAELSEQEFASYVESFRQELLQPPLAPSEEVGQFWGPVRQGGHCFELRGEILKYLNSSSLTREALRDSWRNMVMPEQGVRKRMVVKYFAGNIPEPPSKEEALESWRKQGLSQIASERLWREREAGLVFGHADSAARAELVRKGGYFPQVLDCRYSSPQDGQA